MALADLLNRYVNANPEHVSPQQAEQHFEEACPECHPEMLTDGVAHAFRSDRTPPFADMLSQSFGRADPHQRAGVLNQILGGLGPLAGPALAGGMLQQVLGGVLGAGRGTASHGAGLPQISPEQAQRLDPQQVRELAAQAESAEPGIVDRVSRYYAQNPELVKKLGGAALVLVMANMATRGSR